MQFKDYYKTLGVSKTASQSDIKSAFRKLARKYHPDMVKPAEREAAERRFKEINEAYEVLNDPEKRQKYDTLGSDWDRPQPPPGQGGGFRRGGMRGQPGGGYTDFNVGGTGFSDFFEAFFGAGGGGRQSNPFGGFGGGSAAPTRGADVEADLMVPLGEALRGARRKISLQRGGGEVQSYEIKIPAGVREGQRIRLGGQGEPAPSGGKPGDLFLIVRLAPPPDFRVDGSDLIHELEVPPWQAVLGGEIAVRTLDGTVKLKIPAGSQPGQRFRLRDRGMPKGGGERGHLYVELGIAIPKQLSPKARELWEALAAEG
ncbi:MAG TPA: J domain-containing protein [Chthoniobacteraceae bacterium]|nr:J domain-containing protein [Chthoniobacteraceae bacterium]